MYMPDTQLRCIKTQSLLLSFQLYKCAAAIAIMVDQSSTKGSAATIQPYSVV
jgi:hypothetical protein